MIGFPSGSLEPLPSKFTVSGADPLVGFAVATATGGWLALTNWMRRIVPPSKSA